ncbi:MAG TPA: GNAT family protein [Ureibacillus sp.]|nr:GNAT family protein [Ureibacillus sp.]
MINLRNKPTIVGEKVTLRPFHVVEDFPYLEECLQDPEVLKFTGASKEYNREEILDWYSTRNEQTDRLDLAIVDKSNNILIGEVVVNLYDEETNGMNFRILIGPRGRNRGLGTEVTQLIVDYMFMNTNLNRLTLSVFAFNPRAKKVYEKVGFIEVGIEENDLEYDGQWIDSILMELTKETWINAG